MGIDNDCIDSIDRAFHHLSVEDRETIRRRRSLTIAITAAILIIVIVAAMIMGTLPS